MVADNGKERIVVIISRQVVFRDVPVPMPVPCWPCWSWAWYEDGGANASWAPAPAAAQGDERPEEKVLAELLAGKDEHDDHEMFWECELDFDANGQQYVSVNAREPSAVTGAMGMGKGIVRPSAVCGAMPGDFLGNEPVPEGSGKLDEGTGGEEQHEEGEQYDDDGAGDFVAQFAPLVVGTVCLRGIWDGEPFYWLWLLVVILCAGCRKKLRRRARLRGHGDAHESIGQASFLIIGSAVVGAILMGLTNNNDHLDFVGFVFNRFGGVSVLLVIVFVSSGLVDLFDLGGAAGYWFDLVKVNLFFYLRQWGAV